MRFKVGDYIKHPESKQVSIIVGVNEETKMYQTNIVYGRSGKPFIDTAIDKWVDLSHPDIQVLSELEKALL